MSLSANPSVRKSKRGRRERSRPMSDINVTPFVDVMLVLLVVFMVTAPLLTIGVPVDLPKVSTSLMQEPDEPLTISVNNEGTIFIQDSEILLDKLGFRLIAITNANPEIRIFVKADRAIDYGRVMEVMGAINRVGFKKVALSTAMPSKSNSQKSNRKRAKK